MKKPNITEGEWKIAPSGNISFTHAIVSKNDGGSVCHITDWSEGIHNAKAIAQVPDMIDASIDLLNKLKEQKLSPETWVYYSRLEQVLLDAGCKL